MGVDSLVIVRADDADDDHYTFFVDGVPLWMAKVLRVSPDKGRWFVSFFRGKGIGDEIKRLRKAVPGTSPTVPASLLTKKTTLHGAFEEVRYRNVTDGVLDVDQDSLVVTFDALKSDNRLKKKTVTEVTRVVQAAAALRGGRDGNCAKCAGSLTEDEEGGAMCVECRACSRQFHPRCVGGDDALNNASWWCSECLSHTRRPNP